MAPTRRPGLLLCFLLAISCDPSPLPPKKSVPELAKELEHPDVAVRQKAAQDLADLGPAAAAALPELAKALSSDQDAIVRYWAVTAVRKVGPESLKALPSLMRSLKDPDARVRIGAAKALVPLHEDAAAAAPALVEALGDPDLTVVRYATLALAGMGTAAHPALIKEAGSGDPASRRRAGGLLAGNSKDEAAVVQPLIAALSSENPEVQRDAVQALGCLGAVALESVPALTIVLKAGPAPIRKATVSALRKIGGAAMFPLAELLNDPDEEIRRLAEGALAASLQAIPALQHALDQPDPKLRIAAIAVLGRFERAAAEAIPNLIGKFQDDYAVSSAAADALGRIGEVALLPLILKMRTGNSVDQARAAQAVRQMRLTQPASALQLAGLLDHREFVVRSVSRIALGRMGPAAREARPILLQRLKAEEAREILQQIDARPADPPLTFSAMFRGTWSLSADAKAELIKQGLFALPELIQTLNDDQAGVRALAAEAMEFIGETNPESSAALACATRDPNLRVRMSAISALGRLDPAAGPLLAEALNDDEELVRIEAARALGRLGVPVPEAVPILAVFLKHLSPRIRGDGAWALGHMGASAVCFLVAALTEEEPTVRREIILALGRIGSDAEPELLRALHDDTSGIRAGAALALGRIRQPGPDVAPALIQALYSDVSDVRTAAKEALEKLGAVAVPLLIQSLNHESAEVRALAANILGEIGPVSDEIVPALEMSLQDDEDASVRIEASKALGQLGPAARGAVQAWVHTLDEDPDVNVRESALITLPGVGTLPQEAINSACRATGDERLRPSAFRVLRQIQGPHPVTEDPANPDWSQFRGPNRDNLSPDTGLIKEWPPEGPPLIWRSDRLGLGYSSICIAEHRIYTLGEIGRSTELLALNAGDGRRVWQTRIGPGGTAGSYRGPRSTPATAGGLVFALSESGDLVCVEARSGLERWRRHLVSDLGGIRPAWGYCESPLLEDDLLLCTPGGSKGAVVALQQGTGETVWRCAAFKDRADCASLISAEIGGVRQYVVFTGQSVAGVHAIDGKLLWRVDRHSPTAAAPTPLHQNGLVFVASGYGAGCTALKVTRSRTDFSAQAVYSGKQLSNQVGGVLLLGDCVYGVDDTMGLKCINLETGREIWSDRRVPKGMIVEADRHLIIRSQISAGGAVIFGEPTPAGFREKGRFSPPDASGQPTLSHPVVCGGRLYLRDQDILLCYDLRVKER